MRRFFRCKEGRDREKVNGSVSKNDKTHRDLALSRQRLEDPTESLGQAFPPFHVQRLEDSALRKRPQQTENLGWTPLQVTKRFLFDEPSDEDFASTTPPASVFVIVDEATNEGLSAGLVRDGPEPFERGSMGEPIWQLADRKKGGKEGKVEGLKGTRRIDRAGSRDKSEYRGEERKVLRKERS